MSSMKSKTDHDSVFSPSPVLLWRQHHSQVVSNLPLETLSRYYPIKTFCLCIIFQETYFAKLYILPEPDLERVQPFYQPGINKWKKSSQKCFINVINFESWLRYEPEATETMIDVEIGNLPARPEGPVSASIWFLMASSYWHIKTLHPRSYKCCKCKHMMQNLSDGFLLLPI